MEQYISKAAVVAEIERRISVLKTNESVISMLAGGMFVNEFKDLLSFLNTLDTKEVDERAVSNDLEKAAHSYVDTTIEYFDSEGNPCCYPAFKAGAQWEKEQLMENAVEAVIHPYDGEIWVDKDLLSIYNDCQRVKLIIIEEE